MLAGRMARSGDSEAGSRAAVVCMVTSPEADADAIASALVEGRLAACVSVVAGVRSLYWWKDELERDEEALLILKTTRDNVAAIERLLQAVHPYETFELMALDVVAGSASYLDWIDRSVSRTVT
jgi:periplasmic divalent cation tolerance protein